MARNRVIYQSEALFVSATGDTGSNALSQIHRVQSANYSFDLSRQDVNQFGQLAAIDRIILEQPTVSLDFSYYPESGEQENLIGLSLNATSAISGILQGDDLGTNRVDMHSYFITTTSEGDDAAGNTGNAAGVIGIGNGFLTSYSVEGSVGDFISASVNVEGLNMVFSSSSTDATPDPTIDAVNGSLANDSVEITIPDAAAGTNSSSTIALRHGDVTLSVPSTASVGLSHAVGDFHAQNFSYSFELSRTNLEKLGSRFAYSKEIEFPTTASMDVSAILGDLSATSMDDQLEHIVNDLDAEFSPVVYCYGHTTGHTGLSFTLLGAKLDSQGFSSSIGDNKSVDLSWSTQIGGPQDTSHGCQISQIAG
jgi:hypothetical protein